MTQTIPAADAEVGTVKKHFDFVQHAGQTQPCLQTD